MPTLCLVFMGASNIPFLGSDLQAGYANLRIDPLPQMTWII